MIKEPIEEYTAPRSEITPGLQLVILVSGLIGLLIIFGLLAAGIIIAVYDTQTLFDVFSFNAKNPHLGTALWILQVVSTTMPLFLTPVLFARYIVKEPQAYLKRDFKFPSILLLIVLGIMVFSSPFMEALININEKLSLPAALKGLEDKLRDMEQQGQTAIEAMLQMKTIWDMLFAVFVVGFLTAVAEELLFRGAVQTIFIRWTNNKHAAIWITAILFSAFHMEFFSFLPRLALGVFFGYFVVWSGSIWTSIWAHFLNNASQVVIYYLYQNKMISMNPDDQHVFNYSSYAFSLIIILFLLYIYRNIALGKKQILNY